MHLKQYSTGLKNTIHGAEAKIVKLTFPAILLFILSALSYISFAQSDLQASVQEQRISVDDNTSSLHLDWTRLLKNKVLTINDGHSTAVNYQAFLAQHGELKAYLKQLSAISHSEFKAWDKNQQLAFLINAYNAWTVELIVSNLSKNENKGLKSIKDLGSFFSSPWSKKFIPLLDEIRSLDNIEHELIRGAVDETGKSTYNDPRIHFAVNCASIGCPALREEAYNSENLEQQLEQQTRRFLSDSSRNHHKNNILYLSSIFKWYREDFDKANKNTTRLAQFILQYADALKLTSDQQNSLLNDKMTFKFLDYNWDLNALH